MSAENSRDRPLRFAVLGMVDGNGHPYSWSAIVNGYEPDAMARFCPYPTIPVYLGREPRETMGIPGAQITHVWTDDPAEAPKVAAAARIPHVAARPEEVIGHVDAVLVATDIGHEHVARCRPFVEAGLPVFVDKPLVDNAADLAVFRRWIAEGRPILSSSSLRYAKEFLPYQLSTRNLGDLQYVTLTMNKSWERYGIHALEGIYPILGPGFLSVQNVGDAAADRNVVHLRHQCGADVVLAVNHHLAGAFGVLFLAGSAGHACVPSADTYYAFRRQIVSFVDFVRTGERPFPWAETDELMRLVIAGIRSRAEGGRRILREELDRI